MSRKLRIGLACSAVMFALPALFVHPALGQSTNPWAFSRTYPQAPVALPGQLFASTSGAFNQNLYVAPGSGVVPQAVGSFSTSGGGAQNGGVSLGDYPPLAGLQIPAPAPVPTPVPANPYGTPYSVSPQVQPYQPPVSGLAGQPPQQPYYGGQPYPGTAYAFTPYGYPGGFPGGFPGGYPAYGYGAPFGGMMPGGIFPGSNGMFGAPFGGANLTPWGMMSPWGW